MRHVAVRVAVYGFLLLAAVGALAGHTPYVCSKRALGGALILFMLVLVAGRAVTAVAADTVVHGAARREKARKAASDTP